MVALPDWARCIGLLASSGVEVCRMARQTCGAVSYHHAAWRALRDVNFHPSRRCAAMVRGTVRCWRSPRVISFASHGGV